MNLNKSNSNSTTDTNKQEDDHQTAILSQLTVSDEAPKFVVDRLQQSKLRSSGGCLEQLQLKCIKDGIDLEVTLIPAYNTYKEERFEYFLSEEEEIIEIILLKMFFEQNVPFKYKAGINHNVKFSIPGILREMKKFNRASSHEEIMTSLKIMRGATIIIRHKSIIHEFSILSELDQFPLDESLLNENKSENLWLATFSQPFEFNIKRLEFINDNYSYLMTLKSPLARWLFQRLNLELSKDNTICNGKSNRLYDFIKIDLLTIRNESCILYSESHKDYLINVKEALKELKINSIITGFTYVSHKSDKKLSNVEFTIWINT